MLDSFKEPLLHWTLASLATEAFSKYGHDWGSWSCSACWDMNISSFFFCICFVCMNVWKADVFILWRMNGWCLNKWTRFHQVTPWGSAGVRFSSSKKPTPTTDFILDFPKYFVSQNKERTAKQNVSFRRIWGDPPDPVAHHLVETFVSAAGLLNESSSSPAFPRSLSLFFFWSESAVTAGVLILDQDLWDDGSVWDQLSINVSLNREDLLFPGPTWNSNTLWRVLLRVSL